VISYNVLSSASFREVEKGEGGQSELKIVFWESIREKFYWHSLNCGLSSLLKISRGQNPGKALPHFPLNEALS
jgi:hypothetical protein